MTAGAVSQSEQKEPWDWLRRCPDSGRAGPVAEERPPDRAGLAACCGMAAALARAGVGGPSDWM